MYRYLKVYYALSLIFSAIHTRESKSPIETNLGRAVFFGTVLVSLPVIRS